MARWCRIELMPSGARTRKEIFHCPRCSNTIFIIESSAFSFGQKFLCEHCKAVANPPQPHKIIGIQL